MRRLLTIDPGKHQCAFALWYEGLLVACGMIPWDKFFEIAPLADLIVIEKPVIRPGCKPQRAEDQMDLRETVGFVRAHHKNVKKVTVSDWKNQDKKPHNHRRTWMKLNATERQVIATACKTTVEAIWKKIMETCERYKVHSKITKYSWNAHNALDAAGIGIHELGR